MEVARRRRRRRRRSINSTTSGTSLPSPSPQSPSSPRPRPRHHHHRHHHDRRRPDNDDPTAPTRGFADLPYDLLAKIAAAFDVPNLRAAGMVCRAWWNALGPLREAMLLFRWGKRFKHGRDAGGGAGHVVRLDPPKALDSFLRAAAKGSALAMVDAGLMYWEMGKKDGAKAMYREAAELGHPVGQCNLAIAYLEAEPPQTQEAVKLFHLAAASGYSRAQYTLALCLQHGQGVECNLREAARWYLKVAEGGNPRAMYDVSLCYSTGEGIPPSHHQAKIWLKRAANSGHGKAQFELGSQFFQSGELIKALVFLELATRAGESAALPLKNDILHRLPQTSRHHALSSADKWRPARFRL